MKRIEVPYLVVGAGPVGMMGAILLGRAGRQTCVLERRLAPLDLYVGVAQDVKVERFTMQPEGGPKKVHDELTCKRFTMDGKQSVTQPRFRTTDHGRDVPQGVAFLHDILARMADLDAGRNRLLLTGFLLFGFSNDARSRFRFDIDIIIPG